jgi:hypothetical protein
VPLSGVAGTQPAAFTRTSGDIDGSSSAYSTLYNPHRQDHIRQEVLHTTFRTSGRREVDDFSLYGGRLSHDLPQETRVSALERAQFLADSRKRLLLPYGMESAGRSPLATSRLRASNRVVDEIDQTLDEVYGTHSDDLIKRQISASRWSTAPGHYAATLAEPARTNRFGLATGDVGLQRTGGYHGSAASFDRSGGHQGTPAQFYSRSVAKTVVNRHIIQ